MTGSDNDRIIARLIERVEGRYFGKYRGQVTDNNDPDNLGRVRASVPRLLGDEKTGWALPAFIYGGTREQGLFAIPDIGAGVWIEFEGGDLSYPIWSGTWFTNGAIPESAGPGKKVFKTKSGHKMVFDDDKGSLKITDSNGNSVSMDSNTVKITAKGALKVVIDAPKIEFVEGATSPLVLGDQLTQYLNQLVQLFNSHKHPGEVGTAPGSPITPMPPVPTLSPPARSLLSSKVNTG
jgi:uncharacterized protein involved in type VI secretion and phage assembly